MSREEYFEYMESYGYRLVYGCWVHLTEAGLYYYDLERRPKNREWIYGNDK